MRWHWKGIDVNDDPLWAAIYMASDDHDGTNTSSSTYTPQQYGTDTHDDGIGVRCEMVGWYSS